jgi:DNA polymerase
MNPHKESILRRAIDYFEYLSLYEKELYLKQRKAAFAAAEKAPEKPSLRPIGGLDPYPPYAPYTTLAQMEATIKGCLKCALGAGRTKFVFGVGAANAQVVFIGEGPGAEEDKRGEPFVGRAGKLLDEMLAQIEWRREDVYIGNMIKCRPPNNRDPLPEEIAMCEPYLHEQLRLISPQIIVALGRIAAHALLGTQASLGSLRGRLHQFRGIPLWVTYHPAALLRNPNLMPDAHQDLLTLKKMVTSGIHVSEGEL